MSAYKVLMFRLCHVRPQSRMCMPSMKLLYYERQFDEDWMSSGFKLSELDFEVYRKRGRLRSADGDIPMLSLPWTVAHKMDESSPLFGLCRQDLSDRKAEIIAVAGGIDEITSDNFQKWWSYTAAEIRTNCHFEPMVKCVRKVQRPWMYYLLCGRRDLTLSVTEVLEIHFDRLSLVSPITRYMYT